MRKVLYAALTLLLAAVPALADVTVMSPSNGETVPPSVQFVATANTTTCSKGVASMGIYINNTLKYVVNATSLNTTLSLSPGTYNAVVEEWDYCGGATTTARAITVNSGTGVFVTSPANNSTVTSPAAFVASATTTCSKGVSSVGVYVNNVRVNVTQGSQLNVQIPMSAGTQNTVVEEWDGCGGAATTPIKVTVAGTTSSSSSSSSTSTSSTSSSSSSSSIPSIPSTAKVLSNIQAAAGWGQWGELPPTDNVCNPCNGVTFSMQQHETSVSLSGNGTQYNVGGTTAYADALFYNPIMGQNSKLLPDTGETLVKSLHNFVYDTDVYVPNLAVTQSLEFDINSYPGGGVGMQWGTQCNHLGDGDWDIWNNVEAHWVSTGSPCKLVNGAWNHVTLRVQRLSNNDLLYQSITLNGVTYNINTTVAPFQVPGSWYGMTVNFQMDGNYKQQAYAAYLDNFSVTYW